MYTPSDYVYKPTSEFEGAWFNVARKVQLSKNLYTDIEDLFPCYTWFTKIDPDKETLLKGFIFRHYKITGQFNSTSVHEYLKTMTYDMVTKIVDQRLFIKAVNKVCDEIETEETIHIEAEFKKAKDGKVGQVSEKYHDALLNCSLSVKNKLENVEITHQSHLAVMDLIPPVDVLVQYHPEGLFSFVDIDVNVQCLKYYCSRIKTRSLKWMKGSRYNILHFPSYKRRCDAPYPLEQYYRMSKFGYATHVFHTDDSLSSVLDSIGCLCLLGSYCEVLNPKCVRTLLNYQFCNVPDCVIH